MVKKIYFLSEKEGWSKEKLFNALKDPYKTLKKIEAVKFSLSLAFIGWIAEEKNRRALTFRSCCREDGGWLKAKRGKEEADHGITEKIRRRETAKVFIAARKECIWQKQDMWRISCWLGQVRATEIWKTQACDWGGGVWVRQVLQASAE